MDIFKQYKQYFQVQFVIGVTQLQTPPDGSQDSVMPMK